MLNVLNLQSPTASDDTILDILWVCPEKTTPSNHFAIITVKLSRLKLHFTQRPTAIKSKTFKCFVRARPWSRELKFLWVTGKTKGNANLQTRLSRRQIPYTPLSRCGLSCQRFTALSMIEWSNKSISLVVNVTDMSQQVVHTSKQFLLGNPVF